MRCPKDSIEDCPLLNDIKISLSNINQSLAFIKETQSKHGRILFGTDESTGGLIVEIDRLKEHKKNTEKTTVTVYATAIGLVLKTTWDMIFKR